MTKEEILDQMKEKYEISNDKALEILKPMDVKPCSIDDNDDCLTCGS